MANILQSLQRTIIAAFVLLLLVILIETSQYTQWVIAFSSFSVLLYYAIGHVAVLAQPKPEQKQPRVVAVLGFLLCLSLLICVPGPAVGVSSGIILVALLVRYALRRVALSN